MKYQEEFAKLKLQKLKERHSKHGKNSVLNPNYQLPPFKTLFEHWKEECIEFIQGVMRGDLENIREELADMSNMEDMMFEATYSKDCKTQ